MFQSRWQSNVYSQAVGQCGAYQWRKGIQVWQVVRGQMQCSVSIKDKVGAADGLKVGHDG